MGFNSRVNRPRPEAYIPKKAKLLPAKTLEQALKVARRASDTPTVWKDPKDCIDEWQRVLDMRAEEHPLILGGNYREIKGLRPPPLMPVVRASAAHNGGGASLI